MSRLCRNREASGRPRQRIGRTVTYGVSVEDTGASQLAPWQRTAAGAGLLAPDGTVAPTVFAEMSALALATGAINLGQGFPDEDGPPEVLEAARAAIAAGVNQYPPGAGMPVLREAIARHQRRWYGLEVDAATEVLVTAGATEALAATILAFVDIGDEVVTLEPSYDAYAALVARAGGVHRTVPLRFPDWRPDHDELRAAVTDRTRVILVNSPHNPTGAVLDRPTLELVVELAHRHDAIIVTDEVYEHLVFDGVHTPIATLPGGWERTVSISSGGKTFNTTGWKIGWITAPADLVTAVLAVKQYLTFVNGAPFQPAIATGLDLPDRFFADAAASLAAKRDLLVAGLDAAGFTTSVPQSGYFAVADAAALGETDAAAFCRELPHRAGVVGVPVTAFVHPERRDSVRSLVRFAFCKRREVLEEAASRLAGLSPRPGAVAR
jgi:N-succinyldiaminopimelate aminotransferase